MKKIRSSILIFVSVTLSGLSFSFASLNLDPSEVRPWNKRDKDEFPTPLGAVFKKENKTLIFVGDHHAAPQATYKFIEAAFEKFSPEIVVVESLDFSLGENPRKYLKKYFSKTKEEVWKDPSLAPGTALIALAHHTPVIGGEPSIEEQMSSTFLQTKGFDSEDIRNVQILQRLPYRRDQLKMSDQNSFFEFAKSLYKVTTPMKSFKTDFFAWYKKRTQSEFDYNKITKSESAVNCAPEDTFLQKVACAFNINRDRFLVQHIESLLKKYDRVMVVYGTGHFVQEYPVFKKAFSQEPEYFKTDE